MFYAYLPTSFNTIKFKIATRSQLYSLPRVEIKKSREHEAVKTTSTLAAPSQLPPDHVSISRPTRCDDSKSSMELGNHNWELSPLIVSRKLPFRQVNVVKTCPCHLQKRTHSIDLCVCVWSKKSPCDRKKKTLTYRFNLPPFTENEIHRLITLAVEHHQGGIQPSLPSLSHFLPSHKTCTTRENLSKVQLNPGVHSLKLCNNYIYIVML